MSPLPLTASSADLSSVTVPAGRVTARPLTSAAVPTAETRAEGRTAASAFRPNASISTVSAASVPDTISLICVSVTVIVAVPSFGVTVASTLPLPVETGTEVVGGAVAALPPDEPPDVLTLYRVIEPERVS